MSKEKDNETNHSKYKDEGYEMKANDAKVVRKIVFIVLVSFTLIFVIGILSGYFYIKSALEPVNPDSKDEVHIEIPMGSSSSDIGKILEDNGLIENSKIFRFYLKFKNYSDFQAGEYTLSPSMTLDKIIQELQSGKVIEEPEYRFTIPEGKVMDQIAEIIEKKLNIPKETFLKKVADKKFIQSLIDKYPDLLSDKVLEEDVTEPLEGYLYAGTFEVYEKEPDAESIITLMLEQTNKVITSLLEEIEKSVLSVHEVLTLASIVERESKYKEDRPKVAHVFLNRLEEGMKLKSDFTAAYANNEHKIVMTYKDIEVNSPYNTYVQEGLPPGPIAAPSKEAIMGVLEPEGKDFTALYFYARPSGKTYYANTLEEHNKFVNQYKQEWYDLEKESKEK